MTSVLSSTLTRSADEARQDRRRARYAARAVLWQASTLPRVRACGRNLVDVERGVALKVTTGSDGSRRGGYAGYQSCGSVWACSCCSERVNAERQAEVQQALEGWLDPYQGREVLFLTLTLRHRRKHGARDVWDSLSRAWTRLVNSRTWRDTKAAYGIVGHLRATEVTHGANGWHVHAHVLLFVDRRHGDLWAAGSRWAYAPNGRLSSGTIGRLDGELFAAWAAAVDREDMSPSRAHGLDLRKVHRSDAMAHYFTKATYGHEASSAASEVTLSAHKRGRVGNRTPFQVLADVTGSDVAEGRDPVEDLALWHEYERASKGRRQLVWSRGLRLMCGIFPDERTDEEIAADDHGGETVVNLDAATARALAVRRKAAYLLDAVEVSDAAAFEWLEEFAALVVDSPLDP